MSLGRIIRTRRLLLRPVVEDDLDALHQLWTDPDVRRYLWDGKVISRQRAAATIQKSLDLFRSQGYGLWGAYPSAEGTLIGFGGFLHFHEPPQLELIYGTQPSLWGRGLATEMAEALIRHGFEELGFERIQASTDTPNKASSRVMEKAGMTFVERKKAAGVDHVFYSIRKAAEGSPRKSAKA